MKHSLFIYFSLAALALFASTEYRLGGGALAYVDEETSGSLYKCRVVFSPVMTLDAISNKEMNRLMAECLVEEALEKQLGKPCVIAFSRTSSTFSEAGNKLEYLFDIPKKAISFDVIVFSTTQTTENKPLSREEARHMILADRSSCFRDIALAETYLSSLANEPMDPRRKEQIVTMLEKLEAIIEEDDNLFTREKRNLKQRVRQLKTIVSRK